MVLKFLSSFIIFILIADCSSSRDNKFSSFELFGVSDFDETIIHFYYPDSVVYTKDYKDFYSKLCYLKNKDLENYFTFLKLNDYHKCENLLDELITHSKDKAFAYMLKARLHIHYVEHQIDSRNKLLQIDKQRFNDVFHLLNMAEKHEMETMLISQLIDGISPFLPNLSEQFFQEEMSISDKLNTKINILRTKFNNKNMDNLSDQFIINYFQLTGIDSLDNLKFEGFHGFDPRGQPIFIRDL